MNSTEEVLPISDQDGSNSDDNQPVFWVGIGSSAGGLEAIRGFVRELSPTHNAIYIVAQHMAPYHKSLLSEIIGRETELPVVEVSDDLVPQVGTVYITPPNHDVVVEGDRIILRPPSKQPASPKPSVDVLFKSLALAKEEFAVGAILSGTGSDGAHGIVAIRENGGITVAQDEHSAKYPGMPQAAMETGMVDLIVSPEELGKQFGVITALPRDFSSLTPKPLNSDGISELNRLLYDHSKVDFSNYKLGTFQRRVDRRIAACAAGSLDDYVAIAAEDPEELTLLFNDLLIVVTSFFRDPAEFEGLKRHIAAMFTEKPSAIKRIWIAGVATGEEAYTIAILFAEIYGGLKKASAASFQIFATDLNQEAISVARRGFYPQTSMVEMPEAYIDQYFEPAPGGYVVRKVLREKIVFSVHNVATDPPFLNLDLISCRNLLIYFQSTLQAQVFERFHYALKDNGLLFLGKSEDVIAAQSLFKQAAPEKHIFYQRAGFKRRITQSSAGAAPKQADSDVFRQHHEKSTESISNRMDSLIEGLGPNAVLVNEAQNIVKVFGNLDNFTGLSANGRLSPSISSLIKKPWNQDIRVALPGVFRKSRVYEGMTREDPPDSGVFTRVIIYPMHDKSTADHLALVVFKVWEGTHTSNRRSDSSPASSEHEQTIEELTRELDISKTNLQIMVEELETSNEELQALNEELQSSNEELQSTNEELETSNEELQSTNEELSTVNEELQVNSQQLNAMNQSMRTVLDHVNTPMLDVDKQLYIVNASQSAVTAFNIDKLNGEPNVTNCVMPPGLPPLQPLISDAFVKRETIIKEISSSGHRISLTITPYFNTSDEILGAIVQVIDNTDTVKKVEYQYNSMLDNMPYFVLETSNEGEIIHANENFSQLVGMSKTDLVGADFYSLLHPEYRRSMIAADKSVTIEGRTVFDHSGYVKFSDGHVVGLRMTKIPIIPPDSDVYRVLTIAEQITDSEILEARLSAVSSATQIAVWMYDSTQKTVTCSEHLGELIGRESNCELPLEELLQSVHEDDRDNMRGVLTGTTVLDFTVENPLHTQSESMIIRLRSDSIVNWITIRSQIKYRTAGGQPIVSGSLIRFPDAKRTQHLVQRFKSHQLIERSYNLGFWVQDDANDTIFWSEGLYDLLYLDSDHYSLTKNSIEEFCDAGLCKAMPNAIKQAVETKTEQQLKGTMTTSDGTSIKVSIKVRYLYGNLMGMVERH